MNEFTGKTYLDVFHSIEKHIQRINGWFTAIVITYSTEEDMWKGVIII